MTDLVEEVVFSADGGIYHRRHRPLINDRDGAIIIRKSVCGHWFAFAANRPVAEKSGRLACKTCFRSEV